MKKKVITILLAATLLMTACNEPSKGNDRETDVKEQVTATTTEEETIAESVTEASESETEAASGNGAQKDAALDLTFDNVVDQLIAAYATANESNTYLAALKPNDRVVPPADRNAPLGIKNAKICACGSFDGEVIYIQFMLFEMDMDSEAYKALKVGGKIEYYLTDSTDSVSDEPVIAINGQYVLTAYETYHDGDDFSFQPPYNFKGLNKVLEAFNALK